jgi:hypothetical protein
MKMPKILYRLPISVRMALTKLLMSLFVLVIFVAVCFSKIDHELAGVIASFTVIILLPVTLLWSVDASRIIRREMPHNKSARVIAAILGIPQAVFGISLTLIGVVFPFIEIHDVFIDIMLGRSFLLSAISIIPTLFMLGLGYFYVREGLGMAPKCPRFLELFVNKNK